ncbi:MAG: ABC transporter permease subunit, partial [Pseudomonadota bacterium]
MRFSSFLRLESKLVARDKGAILTTVLLAVVLLAGFFSGLQADRAETAALRMAAERVQEDWAAQPPKNPHTAAHYGILVYRPPAPLQGIEPGVLPYQGAVTFLEAHKRNAPMLSPASVRAAESRYGGTRFSPMLQTAGGFLALVIGFLVGSRESRRGMAALLRGAGTRGGSMVAAKAIVTGALVLAAATSSLIAGAFYLEGVDAAARFAVLAFASLIHLFVLAGIGVASGQWLGSARFGLTAVAFAWGMSVLIIPRMADVVAEQATPLTQAELDQIIAADFAEGPDGHGDTEANEVFEREILAEYGVETRDE